MRNDNDIFLAENGVVAEIGHILGDLAALERIKECLAVDKTVAAVVENADAVAHFGNHLSVYHILGVGKQRHVNGEVIAVDHNILVATHDFDSGIELCLVGFAEEGVKADNIHADCNGNIRHQNTDSAQADNAEGFAGDLGTDELALALFDLFAHLVAAALEGLCPLNALDYLSRSEQQTGEDQLLDRVGVGAGCVENANALLGALVLGDIVGACAGSGNSEQIVAELHVVHGSGANQNRIGILHVVAAGVVVAEALGADGCDFIQGQYIVHDYPSFSILYTIIYALRRDEPSVRPCQTCMLICFQPQTSS